METIIYAEEAHSFDDAAPLTVRRRKKTVASDKAIFDWREGRAYRGDRRKKRERFLQTLPTAPPRRRRATDETRRHLLSATWLSSTRTSRVSDDEGPVSFQTMACEKGRQSEDCERAKRFTAALRRRAMTQHTARARGYIPRPAASETRTADRAKSAMPTTAKACGTPSARARHTQRPRRRAREIRPAIWSTSCARRCSTRESIRRRAEVQCFR